MIDKIYMDRCLHLAQKGAGNVEPNPMVGCVILKDGKIISEGYHHKFGEKHAEIDALDKITGRAEGTTLYVNLEPCSHLGKTPPCVDRIIKEKIAKVVIGSLDPNPLVNKQGVERLHNAGIDVIYGVLEDKCRELNKVFFYNMEQRKPYVFLKIALSQNLFMTNKLKEPIKITNEYSDKIVHKWRSENHAIMVGTGTIISDDPSLTVRNVKGNNPIRIILDRNKKLDISKYKVFNDEFQNNTIVVSDKTMENTEYKDSLKKRKIKLIEINNKNFELNSVLEELFKRDISTLMIEGGVELTKSVIKDNIAQRIAIFIGSKNIENGISPFNSRDIDKLQEEIRITNPDIKSILGNTLIECSISKSK